MSQTPAISQEPTTPAKTNQSRVMEAIKPQSDPPLSTGPKKAGEPSPASTYGETIGGDSVPATPMESVQFDCSVKHRASSMTSESTNEKVVPALLHHALGNSSPARLADMVADLSKYSISDSAINSASCSASDGGFRPDSKTQSASFIVHGADSEMDDPFTSPVHRGKDRSQKAAVNSRARAQSLNGSNAAGLDSTEPVAQNTPILCSPFSPREDRIGQEPSADNAQALYPPDACVFVANLSSARTDEELETSVTRTFGSFGSVYVKIRRDNRHMPYAFCQYENKQNADRAIIEGKNALIDGRRCRTEIAKVQRALYISRHNGDPVQEHEARQLLIPFGAIEKIWLPSETDREMYQLPLGIWVRFAYFQDCRDAHAALRDDSVFRLEQKQEPTKARNQQLNPMTHLQPASNLHSYSHIGYGSPSPRRCSTGFLSFRAREETASLFLGNLPPDVTQQELAQIFSKYGSVLSAQVISKASPSSSKQNVFAFVEFPNYDAVQAAVDCEMGRLNIRGYNVRVEWKVPLDTPRRGGLYGTRSRQSLFGGSPRSRLQLPPNTVPSSSYPPSYHMSFTPYSYYTLSSGPGYQNPSNMADFTTPPGMISGHYGQRPEATQNTSSYLTHPELQTGFLGEVQPQGFVPTASRATASND
ncbi:MAG: hypothetical protein M1821_005242 [Bathelium mastoideum]|nr:MAG: hypothetical protein M1821_005242 [Bathelium mastoideum]